MMIKCPECSHENQLGAIFCRSCGAKLDIERIRPEVKDNRLRGGVMALVQRIVFAIILLALVGVIAGLFLPYGLKEYPAASAEAAKSAKDKVAAIMEKIDNGVGGVKYVFTPEEATEAYNASFLAKAEGGASYAIDRVAFDVLPDGNIGIVAFTKLFGSVPARFAIKVGKPTVKEGETPTAAPSIQYDLLGASMGHVSLPGDFLKGKILEKFAPVAQGKDVEKILNAIRGLDIDEDGNFALTVADIKPAPPAKKK